MKRVFAHIGFSMALALIVLNYVSVDVSLIISMILAVVLIVSIIVPKIRKRIAIPLCLGAALFACLVFMCGNNYAIPQLNLDGKTTNASFYYIDIPEISDEECTYVVKTKSIADEKKNIKLKIKTDSPIDAEPYQIVNAKVKLSRIGNNAYDSYGYFADGIFLSAKAEDLSATEKRVASPWKWIYYLRLDIIDTLTNKLKGDVGALAVALITGYKNKLSDSLYSAFKFAGVTHLMAVSGFHLSVLTFLLFLILKKLKANKKLIAVFGILLVIICIGLAGFSKSIIRAGLMLSILLVGDATKNRADSLNSLGVAVALMCLNPFVVSDVSAQLSVLAILSIILAIPKVSTGKHYKLKSAVATPWVVALFTLPVMYSTYGYISLAGLVSNVIVAPLGSISLVASVVSYIAFKINLLPSVFSLIITAIIRLLTIIVRFFASLKFAVVPLDNALEFVIIGVMLLIALALFVNKSNWIKPMTYIATAFIGVSVILNVALNVNTANILVTQNGATAVVYKNEGYVYGIKSNSDYYDIKTFLFANHIEIDSLEDYHKLEYINAFESNGSSAVDINGITFVNSNTVVNGADIIVVNNEVYDSNGKINLKNGNVLYKIKSNSMYEVERA